MDVACPSLPLKILTGDKLRRVRKHTPRIPARGCRLAVFSLYVQLVNIGIFSSQRAIHLIAQPSLYKTGPVILSRTFLEKRSAGALITLTPGELPCVVELDR
jgi:hypothetical protein